MKRENLLRLINIFNIIIVSILILGCRKIDCPAFPEDKKEWLPYNKTDTIILVSNIDSIILPISKISVSESYSTSWSHDYSYCESYMSLKTATDSSCMMNLNVDIFATENTPDSLLELVINVGPLSDSFYGDAKYKTSNYFNSSIIDGNNYANIFIIESMEKNRFQEITLIKGIGVFQLMKLDSTLYRIPE